MNSIGLWGTLFAMGAVTLLIRLSFIALWGRIVLPDVVREALRFVPPAVLAAIIAPALLLRDNQLDLSLGNERLIAGLVAVLVAWRTRNALATIAIGMITLFLAAQL